MENNIVLVFLLHQRKYIEEYRFTCCIVVAYLRNDNTHFLAAQAVGNLSLISLCANGNEMW